MGLVKTVISDLIDIVLKYKDLGPPNPLENPALKRKKLKMEALAAYDTFKRGIYGPT